MPHRAIPLRERSRWLVMLVLSAVLGVGCARQGELVIEADTSAGTGAQEVLVMPFDPARLARRRGDPRLAPYDSTERAPLRPRAGDRPDTAASIATARSSSAPLSGAASSRGDLIVPVAVAERAARDAGVETVRRRLDSGGLVLPVAAAYWWVSRIQPDLTLELPATKVRVHPNERDTVLIGR